MKIKNFKHTKALRSVLIVALFVFTNCDVYSQIDSPISGVTFCDVNPGTVTSDYTGEFFCIGDGIPKLVQATVTGNTGVGRFGLVNQDGLEIMEINETGLFDMDNFPPASYFLGHASADDASVFEGISNVNDLSGCFNISNLITIKNRLIYGGILSANGPTELTGGLLQFTSLGHQGYGFKYVLLSADMTEVISWNNSGLFSFDALSDGIYNVGLISFGPDVNLAEIDPLNLPPCVDVSNIIQITKTAAAPCPASITDIDGTVYPILSLGSQCWTAKNVRRAYYNDGTPIPIVTDNLAWTGLAAGAYCWLNNDPAYENTHGKLYNWWVTTNASGVCPAGWHVPTLNEWNALIVYLGGNATGGGKVKSTLTTQFGPGYWALPNVGATNETGFSALPNWRSGYQGTFMSNGESGLFWTSTENSPNSPDAKDVVLHHNTSDINPNGDIKTGGKPLRCIKD
jgi:uncharacterized protein (TIGR02145 family)